MGYKRIKDHYKIVHTVQIESNGDICIGSPYIHDIIRINPDGEILKSYTDGVNEDLKRYMSKLSRDSKNGILKDLISEKDNFEATIPVYTYEEYHNAKVIKKYADTFGWPNVCTDGTLQYENTFFRTRKEAMTALLRDTKIRKYEIYFQLKLIKEKAAGVFKHSWVILRIFLLFIKTRTYCQLINIIGKYND